MNKKFLKQAIELSKESMKAGGFPVGAVVVRGGEVLGTGLSTAEISHDPTAHAEVAALRDAAEKTESSSLEGATLYSSMEPCLMCYSACRWASVDTIVYAIGKDKLPQDYYETTKSLAELNRDNPRPKELVHATELEESALEIYKQWEQTK